MSRKKRPTPLKRKKKYKKSFGYLKSFSDNMHMVKENDSYIEIGHVRVYTNSMIKAANVAAKVHRSRQHGTINGVKWECLTFEPFTVHKQTRKLK